MSGRWLSIVCIDSVEKWILLLRRGTKQLWERSQLKSDPAVWKKKKKPQQFGAVLSEVVFDSCSVTAKTRRKSNPPQKKKKKKNGPRYFGFICKKHYNGFPTAAKNLKSNNNLMYIITGEFLHMCLFHLIFYILATWRRIQNTSGNK